MEGYVETYHPAGCCYDGERHGLDAVHVASGQTGQLAVDNEESRTGGTERLLVMSRRQTVWSHQGTQDVGMR